MHAAVVQLAVVEAYFLGCFAGFFCHARHRLAVAFAFLYLFEYHLGHIELAVQVVVEFFLYEVAYELGYGHAVRRHLA